MAEDITVGSFRLEEGTSSLSVPFEQAVLGTQLPRPVAEGIWKKAAMLTKEKNAIVVAPGLGEKDRMVKSTSGGVPHLVTCVGVGEYECDDKCPQYKSLSLCSHTVAAAESNQELRFLTQWYRTKRAKQPSNLGALAMHGMPAGAGRKGGKLPKRKTPSCSRIRTDENTVPLRCGQANLQAVDPSTLSGAGASQQSPSCGQFNVQTIHPSSAGCVPGSFYCGNTNTQTVQPQSDSSVSHLLSITQHNVGSIALAGVGYSPYPSPGSYRIVSRRFLLP